MSVINKMLQDLERRRGDQTQNNASPHSGLRSTFYPPPRRSGSWMIAGMCVMAIAAGVGAYYGRRHYAAPPQLAVAATPSVPAPAAAAPSTTPVATNTTKTSTAPASEVQSLSSLAQKVVPAAPVQKADNVVPPADPITVAAAEPVKPKKAVRKRTPIAPPTNDDDLDVEAETSGPESIEKKARPVTPQQEAEFAYRDGLNLARSNRDQAALAPLQTTLKLDPDHHAARELLAKTQLRLGQWQGAQKTLERGLEISPGNDSYTYLLARIYSSRKKDDAALALLEKNQDQTRNVDLLALKAALYQRANRHAEASESYRLAITLRPQEGRLWLGMGIALEAQNNWREAKSAYEQALQYVGPNDALQNYLRQRLAYAQQKSAKN